MSSPYYDSRSSLCKTPFGAVPTGQEVTMTIHLPKLRLSDRPSLLLYEMDRWDEPLVVPMEPSGNDLLYNRYTCRLVFERPCLYAYYFEVYSEGRLRQLRRGEDGVGRFGEQGRLWQLTVYDAEMQCPSFLRGGVLYQIFPDRFCRSGRPHGEVPWGRTLREDWGGIPEWRPNAEGKVTMSDYFQGDLRGIEEKLGYLKSLGVTAIYLNPIFEAHANHRYNTADYTRVDPMLGTNEDFERLCAEAGKQGIAVILDGVFSHTGSDSVYFNKEKRYGGGGACNDPESPYRSWYSFSEYPGKYDSWWGFETLPNVNETDPSYLDFICGGQGVLRQWMGLGAKGFRLDVVDELPDEFLDRLRECVKDADPDAAILGEVWEDASNKVSYGSRRRYLLGGQMDSVMNYPFQDAILSYIRWGDHQVFYDVVMQILENYPGPAIQGLMNFLSTHDTARAITMLAGPPMRQEDRLWQERHHYLPEEQYRHGCRLFLLASILQFGLPGVPCVYYGDEAGLSGYKDPFNRVCYPWGHENQEMIGFLARLGAIRRDYPIFADAQFIPITFSRDVCSFLREGEDCSILFLINRSSSQQHVNLPVGFADAEELACVGEYGDGLLGPLSGAVLHRAYEKRSSDSGPSAPEQITLQRLLESTEEK